MNTKEEDTQIPDQRGFTRVGISTRKLMVNNFFGGLAWGLGTVLGATVVVALVFFILNKLDTIPYVGNIVGRIIEEVQKSQLIR